MNLLLHALKKKIILFWMKLLIFIWHECIWESRESTFRHSKYLGKNWLISGRKKRSFSPRAFGHFIGREKRGLVSRYTPNYCSDNNCYQILLVNTRAGMYNYRSCCNNRKKILHPLLTLTCKISTNDH